MMKTTRLTLLTGVALFAGPALAAGPLSAAEQAPLVVAQADTLGAAQAEVAAAEAALREAQASGGDVAAAQARLDAAMNGLAEAQAAQSGPEPEPQPAPEPPAAQQPPPQPEPPPQPQPETPVQPEPQEQPEQLAPQPEVAPLTESPQTSQPEAPSLQPPLPPAADTPPEQPSAEQAAPGEPTPQPQTSPDLPQQPVPQAPPPTEAPPVEEPAPEIPPVNEPSTPRSTPPGAEAVPPPELPTRGDSGPQAPRGEAMPETGPRSGQRPRPERAQPSMPSAEQPSEARAPQVQAPPEESPVESQLEAQGDSKEIENVRSLREKLRQEFARTGPNTEDVRGDDRRDGPGGRDARDGRNESDGRRGDADDRRGERDGRRDDGDRRDGGRRYRGPQDEDVVLDFGLGFVVELGDQLVIRRDDAYETERFLDRARDVDVEHFRGGYTRTVVTRRDGTQIYTVRNRFGDIVTRTRVTPNGRQVVLIDNRDFYREGRRPRYSRFDDLPPLRVDIPRDQYIVEASRYDRNGIRAALLAPPVEAVERPYALEEIRTSQRLRDKLRRVDLNTITFDFGSAAVTPSQFDALGEVGWAIESILADAPNEVFLLEGHTDAVGSPTDNLILSDQRAETIAVALSSNFDIPPENLVTQGYGEQYLKVPTAEAERENRRVTVRRITPLVNQAGLTAQ